VSRDDELAQTATAGASGTAASEQPGGTLGRYRLERMLGEGGMGSVYAAFDPDLERRVALKVLRDAASGDQARQRLLREARAMARLTHANVVTVHEVGSAGGRDYVAMELVDGETLAEWLRAEKRAEGEIVDMFRFAGRGLAAAHAAGLVHRDFKPHNVLRRRDGRICVTDFGLARGVETVSGLEVTADIRAGATSTPSSLSGLTATGSVLGTPAYMAPEQWAGGTVGPPADQFAFCVALWEALTGERPFRGPTIEELKTEVARGAAALDTGKLPRRLRSVLVRGLDPEPDKRWPSMDALLVHLARAERRPKVALFAVGSAVVASAAIYIALGRGSAPVAAACEAPAIDPKELASTKFPRQDVTAAFQRDLDAWRGVREHACAEPADKRAPKLACLDGVLARAKTLELAAARVGSAASPDEMIAQLVDPAVCNIAAPPRLVVAPTEDEQAATALVLAVASKSKPDDATIGALLAKPGLTPCARTLALLAQEAVTRDVPRQREIEPRLAAAADQCGDDRLRADTMIMIAPGAFEVPNVGPKGRAAVEAAKVAVDRVPTPDLVAELDELRSQIAGQDHHWDEAFAAVDRAIAAYGKRGMRREQIQAVETGNALHLARNEVADLEAMRAAVVKWKPVAQELQISHLVKGLEMTDAYARLFLGDLPGAHAEITRLWKSIPPTAGSHRKIDGVVVDGNGKPVAGATVAVAPLLWIDSLGPLPFGDTSGLRIVTTDAAGKYEIDDAPVAQGGLFAGLGDRRAEQDLADHAKLVLKPTRRVAGKVKLDGTSRSKIFVMIAPDGGATYVKGFATLDADSAFAMDGVTTGAVAVGVMTWNMERSGDIAFTKVPASSEPVTGLALAAKRGSRNLVVLARSELASPLDGAQVFVMPGRVQVKTAEELNKHAHGAAGAMRFAHPVVGEGVPAAAGNKFHRGDLVAEFDDVVEGEVTACVVGINGDVGDPELWRKLQDHVKDLQVRCVTANAGDEALVVETVPQKRFD
jgi:hypothetical protein